MFEGVILVFSWYTKETLSEDKTCVISHFVFSLKCTFSPGSLLLEARIRKKIKNEGRKTIFDLGERRSSVCEVNVSRGYKSKLVVPS